MNEIVKSGFLDQIFLPRQAVLIDYDFRAPSFTGLTDTSGNAGYLFFNNETGVAYQYSGSKIYATGNPAISYSESGVISASLVSGNFNGKNKYQILGQVNSSDWTFFVAFGNRASGNLDSSQIIFSSKGSDSSPSGFALGINACNRVFCEHNTPSSGKRIYTLYEEIDNKNVISLSKIDSSLTLGFHQFEDLNKISVEKQFPLVDFSPSDVFYIGGLGSSGSKYSNFSGVIDQFMYIDRGLAFPERNTFSQAFFCSGYATGYYYTETSYFNAVTGVQYVDVAVSTGITGYSEVLVGTQQVNGGTVNIYSYSGVTGVIYDSKAVEMTGSVSGQSDLLIYASPSGLTNYGYVAPFASSKILLFSNFDSSYKEVYSFSGQNSNDVNLAPVFSNTNLRYSVLATGSGENLNLYINGLAQPYVSAFSSSMSGDFIISGTYVDSQGFFDSVDSAIYDIVSGTSSITGISAADVTTGTKSIASSYVAGRDLYLNGSKLISGLNYSGVGANVVIQTSDLIDGDLLLLPVNNQNLIRYTGLNDNNFDTSVKLMDEQVWVNGLRQMRYVDYEKLPDQTLKYTTFSLEPLPDIVYNNDTGYFNV